MPGDFQRFREFEGRVVIGAFGAAAVWEGVSAFRSHSRSPSVSIVLAVWGLAIVLAALFWRRRRSPS